MRASQVRRVAQWVVVVAGLAVLIQAIVVLWNFHQWDYLPAHQPERMDSSLKAQMLQDRMEVLTRRVGDMETLVVILLGLGGLYTIVFVVASHFTTSSFSRQSERAVAGIKDQLGLAMGDLRELKEETRQVLREETKAAAERLDSIHAESRKMIIDVQQDARQGFLTFTNLEQALRGVYHRMLILVGQPLRDEDQVELLGYENSVAAMDMVGGAHLGPVLAPIYRVLGHYYASIDLVRSRFYLHRALAVAPAAQEGTAETHYELARTYALLASQTPSERQSSFQMAIEQLRAAFRQPSRVLEDWLAIDIEEGGVLYHLASTPPFDKAINDLLLNVSVGLG